MLKVIKKIFGKIPSSTSRLADENSASSKFTTDSFRQFISATGMDWQRSLLDLSKAYGISRYYDWLDVVYLPETTLLTKFPLSFYTNYNEHAEEFPAQSFSADYNQNPTPEQNFKQLVSALTDKLGQGVRTDSSNCLTQRWQFGVFTVEVLAWPIEKNKNWPNTLHDKYPETKNVARLIVKSSKPFLLPEQSLESLVNLSSENKLDLQNIGKREFSWHPSIGCWDIKLNPSALVEKLTKEDILIWREPSHNRYGISVKEVSYVFDLNKTKHLHLEDIKPMRSYGSGHLKVVCKTSRDTDSNTTIANAESGAQLEKLAETLAKFWNLKIERSTGYAD